MNIELTNDLICRDCTHERGVHYATLSGEVTGCAAICGCAGFVLQETDRSALEMRSMLTDAIEELTSVLNDFAAGHAIDQLGSIEGRIGVAKEILRDARGSTYRA